MLKLNSTMVNVMSLVDFIFLLSKLTQFETPGNPMSLVPLSMSLVPLSVTPRQVDEVWLHHHCTEIVTETRSSLSYVSSTHRCWVTWSG